MPTLFCIGFDPFPKLDIGKICFTESTSAAQGIPPAEKITPTLQEAWSAILYRNARAFVPLRSIQ